MVRFKNVTKVGLTVALICAFIIVGTNNVASAPRVVEMDAMMPAPARQAATRCEIAAATILATAFGGVLVGAMIGASVGYLVLPNPVAPAVAGFVSGVIPFLVGITVGSQMGDPLVGALIGGAVGLITHFGVTTAAISDPDNFLR